VIYVALVVLFFVMRNGDWTDEPRGLVAFYACASLAFFLVRDIWRYGNDAMRWIEGGEAEKAVAAELDLLRADGWLVAHNLKREGRGNLDHFVRGPSGAYAIETKSGRYRVSDRGQAISNAVWAKETFGVRCDGRPVHWGKPASVAQSGEARKRDCLGHGRRPAPQVDLGATGFCLVDPA
jgi:hypothetical protein